MKTSNDTPVLYDTRQGFCDWLEYNYPVDDCIDPNIEDETDVIAAQRLRNCANKGDYPRNMQGGIRSRLQADIRTLYLKSTGVQIDRRQVK
jgi:hypothetical protein